ncbi:hypothetical protein [Arsenophonus nasoniae]|uniref:hypothetical protein n=1 Tax=Arsenophonus nasoniae TaxID=638 RepID=UPI003879CAD9
MIYHSLNPICSRVVGQNQLRVTRSWLVRTVFGLQKPPFGLQKPTKHRNKRTLKTIIADFENKSSDKNKKRSISSVGKSFSMRTLKTKGADFKNQRADFKNQQVGKLVIFHTSAPKKIPLTYLTYT